MSLLAAGLLIFLGQRNATSDPGLSQLIHKFRGREYRPTPFKGESPKSAIYTSVHTRLFWFRQTPDQVVSALRLTLKREGWKTDERFSGYLSFARNVKGQYGFFQYGPKMRRWIGKGYTCKLVLTDIPVSIPN